MKGVDEKMNEMLKGRKEMDVQEKANERVAK